MELRPDVVRVVITIINFCILYFILRHYLFKPVNDILAARKNEVESSIKDASEDKKKAEINKIQSEDILKDSKQKGKSLVEDYRVKAEKLSDEIIKEAKVEAEKIMERATIEIKREKEKAEYEIKKEAVDLAVLLSSKALEESIDEEQHRRLIKEFIAKVGT